jgi:hypothetical protein
VLSGRRVAWIVGNAVAAVALPAGFAVWLRHQTAGAEAFEPAAYSVATVVAAFTAAWWIFLLGLNVTVALLLWFRREDR